MRPWLDNTPPRPRPGPVAGPDGTLWIPGYSASALFRYDPAGKRFARFPLPIDNSLPYVARVHPKDGSVWIGTAAADVVYRFTPATGGFETIRIPTRGASMRHLAIDPRTGDVWVAYGASPAIHPTRIARIRPTGG
ncbi:MAG: hypothetical protein R2882_14265 [Gemmatimonadales bacterium]